MITVRILNKSQLFPSIHALLVATTVFLVPKPSPLQSHWCLALLYPSCKVCYTLCLDTLPFFHSQLHPQAPAPSSLCPQGSNPTSYHSRLFKDTASLNHQHCTPTTLASVLAAMPAFELGIGTPGLCIPHWHISPFLQLSLTTTLCSPSPCPVGYSLTLPVIDLFPYTVTWFIISSEMHAFVHIH